MSPQCRHDMGEALRQLRGALHSLSLARSSPTSPLCLLGLCVDLSTTEAELLRCMREHPEAPLFHPTHEERHASP